jgi:hypothetical protein
MFFPALTPDSVDNRITAFGELIPLAAAERPSAAESVSEEAEERLMRYFPCASVRYSHRNGALSTICSDAA